MISGATSNGFGSGVSLAVALHGTNGGGKT
jgi:hypothetical protein